MPTLESQTEFTIELPAASYLETVDMVLLPENSGSNAMRELRYPGEQTDAYWLPPLIYPDYPDILENFDTVPLTARPLLKSEMTLEDTALARWPGFLKDRAVREIWKGSDTKSRMTAYFFRRLWEYYINPPLSGFITWNPKDRLDQPYNIFIETLTVGGQDVVTLDILALRAGYITGEVAFAFRIIGVA